MDAKSPLVITKSFGDNTSIADTVIFSCPEGAEYEVQEVMERHTTAGSNGGAVTLDVEKCDDAEAIGAGDSVLASTFNLKSTVDTLVRKSTASGLATALATRTIKGGQALALNFTGTLTALAGMCVTVVLVLRRPGIRR